MTNNQDQPQMDNNKQTRILVIGAIVGALTGLGTAYLLIQRSEEEEGLKLTPGEGVKLGVSVFSFLRQITQLG
jgi:glucokinase